MYARGVNQFRARWRLIAIGLCLIVGLGFQTDIASCRSNSRIDLSDTSRVDGDIGEENQEEAGKIADVKLAGGGRTNRTFSRLGRRNGTRFATMAGCEGYTCGFRSTCGLAPLNAIAHSRSSNTPYVVNGEDQVYGEFPSFVTLMTEWSNMKSYGCGGVVVSDRHILTAAHCVKKSPETLTGIIVELGQHKIGIRDAYEVVHGVKSVCAARKFAPPRSVAYDYAVLTLETPIQFNDYIQPACLPYGYNDRTRYKNCYLVGAGIQGFDSDYSIIAPETVQKIRVRQVSCSVFGLGYTDASRACYTKAGSGGGACFGDSGGPILCHDPDTGRWTAIASVSYSNEPKCDGSKGWNDAFARITALLPEIKTECGI